MVSLHFFNILFLFASPLLVGASPQAPKNTLTAVGKVKNLNTASGSSKPTWEYPPVRRNESFVENLHGKQIKDPYRWLEDPDSEETKAFVDAQNKLTNSFVSTYDKRDDMNQKFTKLWNYEKYNAPFKAGDYYYYFYNSGLQAQNVLYRQKTLESKPSIFFDPNSLAKDGTAALNSHSFSKSGNFYAFGVSNSGSDWVTIYVKTTSAKIPIPNKTTKNDAPTSDTDNGVLLQDKLEWAKFTEIDWTKDDAGFFYQRYPKPKVDDGNKGKETDSNLNASLCFHRVGTSQDKDIVIYNDPKNPAHNFESVVSNDGNYLVIYTSKSSEDLNKLYIIDLKKANFNFKENMPLIKVVDNFDASYTYLANEGSTFYFRTNLNAPNGKIVKVSLDNTKEGFKDVVPHDNKDVITDARLFNKDKIVITFIQEAKNVLKTFDLSIGKFLADFPLPIGTITSINGSFEDSEFFFSFNSFLDPGTIYRHDFASKKTSIFRKMKLAENIDFSEFETTQVKYKSKDGTLIPMFIVKPKNTKMNGKNPAYLYGYGGFNSPVLPRFSLSYLALLKHFGATIAVANIRGGGEYGEDWHKAGMLNKKQNVFDDFQYAAKYLIKKKYTCSSKLAIAGGSNGGLLTAACALQAPKLFGAVITDVGVLDMLRYHLFTIGHFWKGEYGDPDKKEDFENLLKYSPLHNVRNDVVYPSMIVSTGDHDDRVVPLHSYKYISTLQYVAKNNPNPLMIRIAKAAGHGAGKPTQKVIEELVDKFSFVALSNKWKWID